MAVPKLRFKEFGSEYITTTFEKLEGFSIQSGKSDSKEDSGEFPFYGSTGVIGYKDSYDYCDEAILIARVGANAGSLYQVKGKYSVSDNTLMLCTSDKTNLNYLRELLIKFNLNQLVFGTGQPLVTGGMIKKVSIAIPSLGEQTKIASFLSAVDEKISQLTQKHELLSQYKQGMMQKLFSQQIRFKADDGSEFGEWEVIQANQIFENYSNKNHDGTLTILAATQDKGVVPRDEIDIDIKSSDASVLSYKIIEKGNFVISLRSFQGGIEYSNYHGICSPAYTILKSIKPIASGFYKNYLKTNDFIQRLSATVIGIRDGKQISYQAFSTLMIDYPSVEEQTKIAYFLSAIDQKIEVVAQQIEQAKQWKKGLLQQMFI
ncbi:Type I restriction modification DNA specificity domain protein [Acinetobacter bouvetii]|uniref:Type I restriction modification DNA specificity domain protein n=1 Tax=Acinetobacter bouvetii TaxID=202951 RepID=A0A811GHV5_9GAMM|nr:restriction endonuclease subunit S [Acinetobacter bouvetii]CAB1222341.1 Type I restriction modification DNA specificity domain protein [Acinetobacter bouvetii]